MRNNQPFQELKTMPALCTSQNSYLPAFDYGTKHCVLKSSDIFRYPYADEFQRSSWVRLGHVHSWNGLTELSNGESEGQLYLYKLVWLFFILHQIHCNEKGHNLTMIS
jgi:hypothetical protein